MPLQSGKNISVRYKKQSGLGSAASGTGGKELPFAAGSAGLNLVKTFVDDPTVRSDGQTLLGRHGSGSVTGGFTAPLRLNALGEIFEAVLRTTATATATLTQAQFTSLTTPTSSTIVAASGDFIALGVRRGMVIRMTGLAATANNNKNFTVTNVTASTITVLETLVVDAVADTSCSIILPRYYAREGALVDSYYTIETVFQDIDASLVATDCVFGSLGFALSPDNTAQVTVNVTGLGMTAYSGSGSPVLTSPTTYSTSALIANDGVLIANGVAIATVTDLSFDYDLNLGTVPVVGANVSPDVFKNNATVSGTLSSMRENLTDFTDYSTEQQFGIQLTLREAEAAPQDFISLYLPLCSYAENSAAIGNDNALVVSRAFRAGIPSVTGTAGSTLFVCTSGTT
jgi:hypothetical protein